jgi:beta-arabinofuranosyltransferase
LRGLQLQSSIVILDWFRFTGTPFFHSMVARAQAAADTDVCVLVDAEIVLLPEIVNALDRFSKVDGDWFLVSLSRNVTDPRYQLAGSGSHWVQADGKEVSFTEVPFRLSKTNATQADKHSL